MFVQFAFDRALGRVPRNADPQPALVDGQRVRAAAPPSAFDAIADEPAIDRDVGLRDRLVVAEFERQFKLASQPTSEARKEATR